MRVQVLGCSGSSALRRKPTTYVVDDVLAIDAGALALSLDMRAQNRIQAVLVSHGHQDHIWGLPLFLANRFQAGTPTCPIYGSAYTLETIRLHQLNDRVWPDFTQAVTQTGPLLSLERLEPGAPRLLPCGYEVEAIAMVHTVPCQGHAITRGGRTLVVGADTKETAELFAGARRYPGLGGVVVECSFPDDLADLALRTGHLTPATLGAALAAFHADVPIWITHMKPGYEIPLAAELAALGDPRIRILHDDDVLDLG